MTNPHEVETPVCVCTVVDEPSPFCPEHNPLGHEILGAVIAGFDKAIGQIPEPKLALAIAGAVLSVGVVAQSDYDDLCVVVGRMASEGAAMRAALAGLRSDLSDYVGA